jgi:hypothetical protein
MGEAESKPAIGLTSPMKNVLVELDEGGGPLACHLPNRFVNLLTPQSFARERFMKMAETEVEIHASELTLLKGSPLNVRISGSGDAGFVKAMINLLPKPKLKAPSSPFEEAQW